jgi:hypothetical protein
LVADVAVRQVDGYCIPRFGGVSADSDESDGRFGVARDGQKAGQGTQR